MKSVGHIAYYCFNKDCKSSVYYSSTIKINDLPLTIKTLSASHYCDMCASRMVSMMDVEIKQAVNLHEQPTI